MRLQPQWFKTQPVAAKVPEVTALFWVVKISTTAAGEALSDWFGTKQTIKWGFFIDIAMFCTALYFQFRSKRYGAWTYWYLALAIATAGTGVSDTMHLAFNMPYTLTTVFWLVVLGVIFFLWNRSEHTLDFHSITTNRREKYYWSVVFATFCLGTAAGDLFASTFGFGYLTSAAIFTAIIFIPWLGWKYAHFNTVFAFWFAYVMTRPIGASFADYFSKEKNLSGLNFGNIQTAIVFTSIVVLLVAYTAKARYDIQPELAPERGVNGEVSDAVAGGPVPEPT